MGVDWSRMRPKPGVDHDELRRLARRQAESFQGMPYYWATDMLTPDSYLKQTRQQFERPYRESSEALRGLLEFPGYDEERARCCDHPGLAPCWRVYPITHNTIFPPQWRLAAYRTLLPDELGPGVEAWVRWLSAVSEGEHRTYLSRLHAHETTKRLYVLWRDLREDAVALRPEDTARRRRPVLTAMRGRVLGRPAPEIAPAPMGPTPADVGGPPDDRWLMGQVTELLSVIREWAEAADDEAWRGGYEADFPDFDGFLAQARDPWRLDFLRWAEACRSLGMGLFLGH